MNRRLLVLAALLPTFAVATAQTTPTVRKSWSTPGSRTVTLTVCNAKGCSTKQAVVTVLDPKPVLVSWTTPALLGSNDPPASLSAVVQGKPPVTTKWTLTSPAGAVRTATGTETLFSPVGVGTHQVQLALSSLYGSVPASKRSIRVVASHFSDVSPTFWAWDSIETLSAAGITQGCAAGPPPKFCPTGTVSRAEAAVLLLRAMRGPLFTPPPASGRFADVAPTFWAAPAIEQLVRDGIVVGCDTRRFCPADPLTRAQMAVLLVRAVKGPLFSPPAPIGLFADVSARHWAAPYIETLAALQLTSGCQFATPKSFYCPDQPLLRSEIAVFLVRAFQLQQKPVPSRFEAHLCGSAGPCSYPTGLPLSFEIRLSGGTPEFYDFDWNGDGIFEESLPFPTSHIYSSPGSYTPVLRLRRGTWSSILKHPRPLVISSSLGFLSTPGSVTAAAATILPPLADEPPGTPLRLGYTLQAASPASSVRGYAAYVARSGDTTHRFVGLLAAPRSGATDLLRIALPQSEETLTLQLRAFSASGTTSASFPVKL